MDWEPCLPSLLPIPMAGDPKTGCLLRWSLIPAGYHGNLPGSGGHPGNPPGSHPDPEHTGECVCSAGVCTCAWCGRAPCPVTVCEALSATSSLASHHFPERYHHPHLMARRWALERSYQLLRAGYSQGHMEGSCTCPSCSALRAGLSSVG